MAGRCRSVAAGADPRHRRDRDQLSILGQAAPPPIETFSLALENALIGVRAPRLLLVSGRLADPAATVIAAGSVTLLLDSLWLVPILPDPYAASFDCWQLRDRLAIGLLGMTFRSGADVAATVAINAVPTAAPSPAFNAVAPPPILPAGVLTLLDLSTKVDLFGVQVDHRAARADAPRVQAPASSASPSPFTTPPLPASLCRSCRGSRCATRGATR